MVDEELLEQEENENKPQVEEPVEDSDNEEEKKKNKLGLIIKILVIILLLLLLLSLGILLIRIADFLPNDRDIIFIEPKLPDVEVSDDEVIWETNKEVNIFRTKEVNESGQVVVESSNGDKIIAPGMEGSYRFYIKNKGNIALNSKTVLGVEFIAENLDYDYSKLPIEIRFVNYQGKDLTGKGWVSVDEVDTCIDELTLGKNRYAYYTLEWRWLFETGDDDFDTLLGDLSVDSKVELTVNIAVSATQAADYDADGGLDSGLDDPRTGGDLVPAPYIALNILILLIIIALIILEIIKRKKQSKELEENLSEKPEDIEPKQDETVEESTEESEPKIEETVEESTEESEPKIEESTEDTESE